MKRTTLFTLVALALAGAASYALIANRQKIGADENAMTTTASPRPTSSVSAAGTRYVVAPGFVEAASEEINVSAELNGKLRSVTVEEGDEVKRGQVIATLENDDYRARLAAAQANLQQREAELLRLENGSRLEERAETRAAVREAEAVMNQAQAELTRREGLMRNGDIAREETERAAQAFNVAKARFEAAQQRADLTANQTRDEDKARALANIAAAKAQIAEARALLDKTVIRAPLGGIVLRKQLHAGEIASNGQAGAITPIITLADNSVLRVRVDVDEADIGHLQVGQSAFVKADAFGERRFAGKVIRIGQVLGRKNVRTEKAAERVDTKVLETLIELESNQALKLGLRVDAFISTSNSP
jgi:multidrug resistance efflux pump